MNRCSKCHHGTFLTFVGIRPKPWTAWRLCETCGYYTVVLENGTILVTAQAPKEFPSAGLR